MYDFVLGRLKPKVCRLDTCGIEHDETAALNFYSSQKFNVV